MNAQSPDHILALEGIARRCDRLNEWVGRGVAWLTLGMVAVTFLIVVLRYAFDLGSIALQESVTYMHAMVFMLGGAYTLRHNGHVRVDIFYRRLGERGRARVDLAGALVLLLPLMVFIGVESWDYVLRSWSLLEGSREPGGLPAVFLLKTVILAMCLLFFLQGLSQAIRSALVLAGHGHLCAETPPQEL